MKYKALVLGCGKIGAGYDWDNEEITTHAKALYKSGSFDLSFYDADYQLASEVARRYMGESVRDLEGKFDEFDLVSICTPTQTHVDYLQQLFKSKTKIILCEKPISIDKIKMEEIVSQYKSSRKFVVVNYIRRFQPDYIKLKEVFIQSFSTENLSAVIIRYTRGFINNASHALDLVEFILGKSISLKERKIGMKVYDTFDRDPTMIVHGVWNNSPISLIGISGIEYPHFEIDFFFSKSMIRIYNSGNSIRCFHAVKNNMEFESNFAIKNYMVPVIQIALDKLKGNNVQDNFLSSADLNYRMLEWLEE